MHKLALLFVHFCCLLSRISIPSVKRRCNLSHLSLFHKYIEIMKGFYIVRTLSFSSISGLLFLYVSVFLPVVVSAFLHRSSPPYYHCRYAETYTTNHNSFYFFVVCNFPNLKVLQNAAYFQSVSNITEKKKYLST